METAGRSTYDRSGPERFLAKDYWRDRALEDILPPWLEHSIDTVNGGFHTNLSRTWERFGSGDKYPAMLGRHLYSFSAAYLLSGEDRYLELAGAAADYLIRHGWDREYGGWFHSLAETGAPKETWKDAFTNMYASTGCALYYHVTRDAGARRCVEEANRFYETHADDPEHGGYYKVLNRDGSARSMYKSFNPQIGNLSSYLLYFALATGLEEYRSQMRRAMDTALLRMRSPVDGFILDYFDRAWKNRPMRRADGKEVIAVGGNLETVWVLIRLHLLTGVESYRRDALELAARVIPPSWDAEHGGWYESFCRGNTGEHGANKAWFIQAYGNFTDLNLYRLNRDPECLERFCRTSEFWERHFIDHEHGGDVTSVDRVGSLVDGTKASRTKCSYHSLEHCLLNYLYLGLYVLDEPVVLHYRIDAEAGSCEHPVCPVEDPRAVVISATLDGKPLTGIGAGRRSVILERAGRSRLSVELQCRDRP
jgi:mannobiose 2-epimerase